jgi:hypothetical protein
MFWNVLASPILAALSGLCGYPLLLEKNVALLWFIEAVYAVEQAGLAGAVGAYDSQYLVFFYIHAHIYKRVDPPEGQGKIFYLYFNLFIVAQYKKSPYKNWILFFCLFGKEPVPVFSYQTALGAAAPGGIFILTGGNTATGAFGAAVAVY